ncbi:DNA modification methylase [Candidatus Babeliales bacterium]|nr:DNA modification methylase [Candidatus Babeliales bacterium]
MSKLTWSTEKRKVADLIPADYNPRKISHKEREDLEASIHEFDAVIPLVVNTGDRGNRLIGGHQRSKVYADLGIEEVEVRVPDRELTIQEEKALNLRLNKNTAGWDFEKLAEMDMDMLLDVGFGDEELSAMWDDVDTLEDEFNPPTPKEHEELKIRAKDGDVFTLGGHTVVCGITPPKGTLASLIHLDLGSLDDENMVGTSLLISELLKYAPKSTHTIIWGQPNTIGDIQTSMRGAGVDQGGVALWIRNFMTPTKVAFNNVYEPCVFGYTGKPYVNKRLDKTTEVLNKEVEKGSATLADILSIADLWTIQEDENGKKTKPVNLYEIPLKRCTKPGDIIIDRTVGGNTGAMLIACEQLGRKAVVLESDPEKVTLLLNRWEELTGYKAKKN